MEQLSGLDASFLYLETPSHHMHVAMAMVIDPATAPGGYTFDSFKAFLASRVHLVPLFHRRIVEVPFRLSHPVWVEDPDFDLDYHVRRVAVPKPGGRRELADLAAQIAGIPLDRTRPLWEMWYAENLKHDRVGIIAKVHHSTVDGVSGADVMTHLFDLARPTDDSPPPPPTPLPHERMPSEIELAGQALSVRMRRLWNMPRLLTETVQAATRVIQGRRDPEQMVGAVPLTAPRVPWNGPITPHRTVGFARVPLADVKKVKNAFGAKVNDVVLALCAGTLRAYLEAHDALPDDPLLAVCPISVHEEGEQDAGHTSNKVSAMFVNLATDVDDPGVRLTLICESTKGAKSEHKAVGAKTLMNLAEFAPPTLFNLASRLYSSWHLAGRHRPIHNVIISNVPGPPFPIYYNGAEMVATYPMGPVMEGCGLNITVFSYRDSVDVGIMACRELIPDVWTMAESVQTAMDELVEAADRFTGASHDGAAESATATASETEAPAAESPAAEQVSAEPPSAERA